MSRPDGLSSPAEVLDAAQALVGLDHEQGLALCRQALEGALAAGEPGTAAESETWVGRFLWTLGRYPEAEVHYRQARERFVELGHAEGQARLEVYLAQLQLDQGALIEGLAALLQVLPRLSDVGEPRLSSMALISLGKARDELGDHAGAVDAYLQARTVAQQARLQSHEVMILNNLGGIHEAQNRHQEALHAFEEALSLAEAVQDGRGELYARMNIGFAQHHLGKQAAALTAFDLALQGAQSLPSPPLEVRIRMGRMLVYAALNQPEMWSEWQAAQQVLRSVDAPLEGLTLQLAAAELLLKHSRAAQALEILGDVLAQAERLGLRDMVQDAHAALSRAYGAEGDFGRALQHHRLLFDLHMAAAREDQALRTQALLIVHEVEQTRAAEREQRRLNDELQQVNAELQVSHERNQALMKRLQHLAHHDVLTGLPNRAAYREALDQVLAAGRPFALLLVDLDGFKTVNDTFGHEAGDEVLLEVARRLHAAVRPSDLVARLGGDEFVIIAALMSETPSARELALDILAALAVPWGVQGQQVQLSASIGVSCCPEDGTDSLTLQQRADAAMYQVKRSGKNAVSGALH